MLPIFIDLTFAEQNDIIIENQNGVTWYKLLLYIYGIPERIQVSMCYLYIQIY